MKTITLESGNIARVGGSAAENFDLIDQSLPNDLWFHLAKLPSCHVVLSSCSGVEISGDDIMMAAKLCLENTKYHGLRSVYVEYLPVKYVEKTKTLGRVILRKRPTLIKVG